MNNIESVLITGSLFFVSFMALFFLVEDLADSSLDLDDESLNLIGEYRGYNQTIISNQSIIGKINNTGLLNYDQVAAEAREAAEAKGTITLFTDMWDIFVIFPAVMISSFTFIDKDTGIFLILLIQLILGMISIYVIVALYKAWRLGTTNA